MLNQSVGSTKSVLPARPGSSSPVSQKQREVLHIGHSQGHYLEAPGVPPGTLRMPNTHSTTELWPFPTSLTRHSEAASYQAAWVWEPAGISSTAS